MHADGNVDNHILDEAEREELIHQHRSSPRRTVPELTHLAIDLGQLRDRTATLIATTVSAQAIQTLKENPSLANWVHEGLRLHRDRDARSCLFCSQALPEHRMLQLERHFNVAYDRLLGELTDMATEIRIATEAITALILPNTSQFYDHLVPEYTQAEARLSAQRSAMLEDLNILKETVSEKKSYLFERVTLPLRDLSSLHLGQIETINRIIRKHNQISETHTDRAKRARRRLELAEVASSLKVYEELLLSVKDSESDYGGIKMQLERVNTEIIRLEMEITEYRKPAEELNQELCMYLGHSEIQLKSKDTGYTLVRNGTPASEVSEGETTAIALLYFLKTLSDHRFDLTRGIIVLDDPISSLDANSLYVAFGLIQQFTSNAGQLFILTHNFTFFRQVRNWFQHIRGPSGGRSSSRPVSFYMLDCIEIEEQRTARIQELDPLLEQYESDYQYLFSCVYKAAFDERTSMSTLYTLPNIARRVLEAFLAFRRPDMSGDLWNKIRSFNFDDARELQILRFVNEHSHSDAIIPPEHDPSVLGETREVLKATLDFMKKADPDHFNGLVTLIKSKGQSNSR